MAVLPFSWEHVNFAKTSETCESRKMIIGFGYLLEESLLTPHAVKFVV